ncbi:uncharacterized protein LOC144091311 [Stigmatopora argus]
MEINARTKKKDSPSGMTNINSKTAINTKYKNQYKVLEDIPSLCGNSRRRAGSCNALREAGRLMRARLHTFDWTRVLTRVRAPRRMINKVSVWSLKAHSIMTVGLVQPAELAKIPSPRLLREKFPGGDSASQHKCWIYTISR